MPAVSQLHLDLDGAWPRDALPGAAYLDLRERGAALRYCTTGRVVEDFLKTTNGRLADFTLYGSGDFHHVSSLLLRRVERPFTLVSFDNHPDWDIRPPHWCCGTWMNRALEIPNLQGIVIWGCANGELNWPGRWFANHKARRAHRLDAFPWAERTSTASQKIWPVVTRANWRLAFSAFAQRLTDTEVYVTVDMDCLTDAESVTNWEHGRFTAEDIAWALREIRGHAWLAGGDVCGAWSPIRYARFWQRVAGKIDHPPQKPVDPAKAAEINIRALRTIWPALVSA
jgi:hypothetical protein